MNNYYRQNKWVTCAEIVQSKECGSFQIYSKVMIILLQLQYKKLSLWKHMGDSEGARFALV